jgi:lysophospholipase L1-like esterase
MIKNIILLGSTLTIIVLFIISIEGIVRYSYPEINNQCTAHSLWKANVFGTTEGWKPNSKGVSFGVEVDIDENGFRKHTYPEYYNESWIVLGDSVGFGVGVKGEALFSQLLQDNLNNKIRIWNTSVVGYSLREYRDVISKLISQRKDITKVILVYCLNDIYKLYFPLTPKNQTVKEKGLLSLKKIRNLSKKLFRKRVLRFLKINSKLYVLLASKLKDRSKNVFLYDMNMYTSENPRLNEYLDYLMDINSVLSAAKIDFIVVVLPYEYQLRMKSDMFLRPQQVLGQFLKDNNIKYINAYDYFTQRNESGKYYLYSDGMHLSEYGHRQLFEVIYGNLLSK